jgi:transposase InsO family protein
MKAQDVSDTLTMALRSSGLDAASVSQRPRLLSDNGSSYIAGNLAEWLKDNGFDHIRGAPLHPQTQGKIERWHQTLKNRILLENYYDLIQRIALLVRPGCRTRTLDTRRIPAWLLRYGSFYG